MELTLEEKEVIKTAVEFYSNSLTYLHDNNELARKRKFIAQQALNKILSYEDKEIKEILKKLVNKSQFEDLKEVYTIDEAKEILGISKTSIYELIRQNKLKALTDKKPFRIPRKYLQEYMEGGAK